MASRGVIAPTSNSASSFQYGRGIGGEGEERHLPGPRLAVSRRNAVPGVRAVFEVLKDLGCPVYDGSRDSGQLGDVDTVALVGASGLDLVQEDGLAVLFGDGNVAVDDPGQGVGQLYELMVVGGKDCPGGDTGARCGGVRLRPGRWRGRHRCSCPGRSHPG